MPHRAVPRVIFQPRYPAYFATYAALSRNPSCVTVYDFLADQSVNVGMAFDPTRGQNPLWAKPDLFHISKYRKAGRALSLSNNGTQY
jgi:hypothetical protein